MKILEIDGRKFYYSTRNNSMYSGTDFAQDDEYTDFYVDDGVIKFKKYIFWGPETRKIAKYKKVFTLHIDIESSSHSKEYVRDKIDEELTTLYRKEEIERGEII